MVREWSALISTRTLVAGCPLVLAWLVQPSTVTAPTVGATRLYPIDDAVASLSLDLTADEIALLEEPCTPNDIAGFGRRSDCEGELEHCDEFPFLSTTGSGPTSVTPASLRVINAVENLREGRQLKMFYDTCGIKAGIPFLVVPTTIRSDTPGLVPTVAYCGLKAFAPGKAGGP